MSLTILVSGATGRLGGPLARRLLACGHAVRAVTRDPSSAAAQRLRSAGADLVAADLDDRDALGDAARGVDAVFVATTPHAAGLEAEVRHAINLVDAARSARAGHIVYSSAAGADRPTGVPMLEAKRSVEERLREAGIAFTVVAPVYFMENALNPWNVPALRAGRLALALGPDDELAQIAIADVAAFAALVIVGGRDGFAGERIEIASDRLTGPRAAAILSRATGREIAFDRVPIARLHAVAPGPAALFAWLARDGGFAADPDALRARYPDVGWHTFEAWAAGQDWSALGRD